MTTTNNKQELPQQPPPHGSPGSSGAAAAASAAAATTTTMSGGLFAGLTLSASRDDNEQDDDTAAAVETTPVVSNRTTLLSTPESSEQGGEDLSPPSLLKANGSSNDNSEPAAAAASASDDRLLGQLHEEETTEEEAKEETATTALSAAVVVKEEAVEETTEVELGDVVEESAVAAAAAVQEEEETAAAAPVREEEEEPAAAAPASTASMGGIFGWFSGLSSGATSASAPAVEETPVAAAEEEKTPAVPPPADEDSPGNEEEEESATVEAEPEPPAAPTTGTTAVTHEDDGVLVEKSDAAGAPSTANGTDDEGEQPAPPDEESKQKGEEDSPPPAPPKREMTEEEQKELDEAFQHSTPRASAAQEEQEDHSSSTASLPTGRLTVRDDTPVPHADVCLKLLRRFAYKTRPKILTQYGGSLKQSLLSYYLFTSARDAHQQEITFQAYQQLLDCVFDEHEDRDPPPAGADHEEDSERILAAHRNSAATGGTTVDADTRARAAAAVAAFVDLFSTWGHVSSALLERKDRKGQQAFADLQVAIFDAASNLVAYGCLDWVQIQMHATSSGSSSAGSNSGDEKLVAAQMLAQSVFNCDLSLERVELAAMKFLLGAGCRQTHPSLLRGSHLLQTIRTLYHIYLTTESKHNKTTARAALQQLVTSVFTKLVDMDLANAEPSSDNLFPSDDHRDAFLVLRSICKLSMRSLPDQDKGMHSHIGLQTSASNDSWDGDKVIPRSSSERGGSHHGGSSSAGDGPTTPAKLVYTSAIHPALESKLLALELILYVLQNTNFSVEFVQHCGVQFQSAIRNYLCVSLLKNCTSDNTRVVSISLRIFVPVVRSFRTVLKTEIEAFVTNVFFVILDSKNSPAEHKSIVVNTFNEICSDPSTLAEIFLNYDCDLSAVDLFHRIVNTLSRLSRTGLHESHPNSGGMSSLMGGPSEAAMEKFRNESRELRLDAMRALRQILASLHASIVEPMPQREPSSLKSGNNGSSSPNGKDGSTPTTAKSPSGGGRQNLVEIYGSKKKRRAEESEAVLRFNQKPSAGIAFAAKCNHIDPEDPVDVARYLLKNKDEFDKTQIGEYLGREAEYQNGFSLRVLHEYARLMDFTGLVFDDAIRFFLSGFRLPGEAQKIDRIMEKFAERFTEQNPDVFPSADVAFILSFSIIMLNTDLHNPAIKEERRMTKEGFVRNNRGICDGQDLPEELLTSIFDRIKANPISLKEDDEARERTGDSSKSKNLIGLPAALSPASFFASHYNDVDRARETNFQKERDHIVRTTESLLKRRRHSTTDNKSAQKSRTGKSFRQNSISTRFVLSADSGLRDEYVSPMFEVTWGPALAAFATAMESANGTVGALISIASDEELELAAENAAETIEVCLTGFRFAIGTAGLCGNSIARDAYMLALSRFSQLGTGVLLEPRHLRCVQTMLSLAREDGELLGGSWEHVFKALSEINRFHQLFHLMARNDRAAAIAAERRKKKLQEKEERRQAREQRKAAAEDGESVGDLTDYIQSDSEDEDSLAESDLFTDDELDFGLDEDSMDAKAIDEANAREIYDAVSEATIEAIYERSSSLSADAVKEFVVQLCLVSRAEISVGANDQMDLNQVPYRQKHELLSSHSAGEFHHTQPNIYNLQKLVEVTHYNMTSRPRLIFAELWVTVADHLTYTALHSNQAIAMYAVDSFRQLCIQYLQKDELEVFEFQRRFLKPLETIMARSTQTSTKELLLNCVSRLMHVFGTDPKGTSGRKTGGLRSGWVPLLTILGLGGCDSDEAIAQMSFKILSDELEQCLNDEKHPDVLLTEHFVETVNALLLILGGPHTEISLLAMGNLVTLANALANGRISPLLTKRKAAPNSAPEHSPEDDSKQRLELWWPILLGLSRCIGDARFEVRSKALESMFAIINGHFVPSEGADAGPSTWETLQLIFRGVLNSVLEFAETSSDDGVAPGLPDDFELILNDQKEDKKRVEGEQHEESVSSTWLETTFDSFMDECIGLCIRSMKCHGDAALVEEVFALLNSCLISDSGALAVRGLRRLEQFLTSDLDAGALTDDVWATVSHMLQKCLTVRGLPKRNSAADVSEEQAQEIEAEYAEGVREFRGEDQQLSYRRYVGSNATMVIGLLLTSERFSIGLRWRLFLIKWLNRGVREWEAAAEILSPEATSQPPLSSPRPPDYRENALYGRKWINRLVLQLASIKEIAEAPSDADAKNNRFAQGQKQVIELTEALLASFVQKEEIASEYYHSALEEVIYKRYTALVHELLSGFGSMDSAYLQKMSWISPVLLSSCIRSKNEEIRLMVQKLVSRTSADSTSPTAYPAPVPKSSEAEKPVPEDSAEESTPKASEENGASATPEATDPTDAPEAAVPNGIEETTA